MTPTTITKTRRRSASSEHELLLAEFDAAIAIRRFVARRRASRLLGEDAAADADEIVWRLLTEGYRDRELLERASSEMSARSRRQVRHHRVAVYDTLDRCADPSDQFEEVDWRLAAAATLRVTPPTPAAAVWLAAKVAGEKCAARDAVAGRRWAKRARSSWSIRGGLDAVA